MGLGIRHIAVIVCATGCAVAGEEQEGTVDGGAGRADSGPRPDARVFPDAATASACGNALAELTFDWELGAQGFTHGALPEVDPPPVTWTYDHWQLGSPSQVGPGSCASGSQCFGTNQQGNYIFCQRAYLASPAIDLSACGGASDSVSLIFDHYYDFWTDNYDSSDWFDGGLVEISGDDGATWQAASISYPGTIQINPNMGAYECVVSDQFYVHGQAGFVGLSGGWQTVTVAIPQPLRTTTFRVRFVYSSGVAGQTATEPDTMNYTRPGWYVDNLHFAW